MSTKKIFRMSHRLEEMRFKYLWDKKLRKRNYSIKIHFHRRYGIVTTPAPVSACAKVKCEINESLSLCRWWTPLHEARGGSVGVVCALGVVIDRDFAINLINLRCVSSFSLPVCSASVDVSESRSVAVTHLSRQSLSRGRAISL